MGASVKNLSASKSRTFVLWAQTDRGVFITRDGGLSWRAAASDDKPAFPEMKSGEWISVKDGIQLRIDESSRLVRSTDGGKTGSEAMQGWRIPLAKYLFGTPWGVIAGGPGGAYRSDDGRSWDEIQLWHEQETGAADFLHAYWMGRYYGFVPADGPATK